MGLVVRGIVLRSGRILFCHVAKSGLCSHNLSFFDGSFRHFKTAGKVRQAAPGSGLCACRNSVPFGYVCKSRGWSM